MKKFKKAGIAAAIVIIFTIAGMYHFRRHAMAPKEADLPERAVTDGADEQALVPLEIIPPAYLLFAEPFDRSMGPVPNLEDNKGYGDANAHFLVPTGTTNVALGKPVSSSDDAPIIGSITMVNDGKKERGTRPGFVELGPGLQHITIDLLQKYEIYAIVVWHSYFIGPVYFDVVVQVSSDPDFTNGVRTLFNNDSDNSSGLGIGQDKNYRERQQGKLINTNGVRARYVRLYSNGNSGNEMNHYNEVEVYGRPIE